MKPHQLLLAAALFATAAAHGDIVTETYGPNTPGTLIPDNNTSLTSFLMSVNASAIQSLTEVTITLDLRGNPVGEGWANDIFASLLQSPVGGPVSGSDPSAILLNQVGGPDADPLSFGYDGWSVTFKDSAANDIHDEVLLSGVLTGEFQPDGRILTSDTARPALLSVFIGGTGNGDWRLNIGDLAETGTMELVSWSLTLTGDTLVPEPSTWVAGLGLAGVLGVTCWRRKAAR